jgi:hypothetical protein
MRRRSREIASNRLLRPGSSPSMSLLTIDDDSRLAYGYICAEVSDGAFPVPTRCAPVQLFDMQRRNREKGFSFRASAHASAHCIGSQRVLWPSSKPLHAADSGKRQCSNASNAHARCRKLRILGTLGEIWMPASRPVSNKMPRQNGFILAGV